MTKIKIHIFNVKLPFYPPCEVKYRLQNGVSTVSRSSVEAFKSIQEIKQKCKFIKARQVVDTCLTPPICRGLRISNFNYDFLGIPESVYKPFFLLTLDI